MQVDENMAETSLSALEAEVSCPSRSPVRTGIFQYSCRSNADPIIINQPVQLEARSVERSVCKTGRPSKIHRQVEDYRLFSKLADTQSELRDSLKMHVANSCLRSQ
jgi:hypothetical protein